MKEKPSMDDYLKAAKIVSTCPASRLPYVLELLAQSGIELENMEEAIQAAKVTKRKGIYSRKNGFNKTDKWGDSTDMTVIRLKKAYLDGISFTALGKLSGVNRVSLYKYVEGGRSIPLKNADAINEALDKIYAEEDSDGRVGESS